MRQLWVKYKKWAERRRQKHLKWWERKRVKGKSNFIWRGAIIWSTCMIVGTTLSSYFLDHEFSLAKLIIGIPLYLIGGYFVGLIGWHENEKKYQKSMRTNVEVKSHVQ